MSHQHPNGAQLPRLAGPAGLPVSPIPRPPYPPPPAPSTYDHSQARRTLVHFATPPAPNSRPPPPPNPFRPPHAATFDCVVPGQFQSPPSSPFARPVRPHFVGPGNFAGRGAAAWTSTRPRPRPLGPPSPVPPPLPQQQRQDQQWQLAQPSQLFQFRPYQTARPSPRPAHAATMGGSWDNGGVLVPAASHAGPQSWDRSIGAGPSSLRSAPVSGQGRGFHSRTPSQILRDSHVQPTSIHHALAEGGRSAPAALMHELFPDSGNDQASGSRQPSQYSLANRNSSRQSSQSMRRPRVPSSSASWMELQPQSSAATDEGEAAAQRDSADDLRRRTAMLSALSAALGDSLEGGFRAAGGGSDGFGDGPNGMSSNGGGRREGSDGAWSSQSGGGSGEASGAGGGRGGGDDADANDKAARKANPLLDLIETEAAYVAELSKIIRKVAAAWSRSNFPPAELDTMFRNVESIYRVNRGFLKSLKDIGPNPSSPRALGDLLMRWIDDLEAPYSRYCDNYFADFDTWPVVQSNERLPILLREISDPVLPDGSPVIFSDKKRQPGDMWTLDQLFALPQVRLKYYKKLYSRLLKSTQPGRSDHRLLVGANEKLDELLERAKNRISMSVLDEGPPIPKARMSEDSSMAETSLTNDSTPQNRASSTTTASAEGPDASPPPIPKDSRVSPPMLPTKAPSLSAGSPSPERPLPPVQTEALRRNTDDTISANVRDSDVAAAESLELRLDTDRTLDIFTMKPKKCQLRMNPPTLPFKRTLRKSADVVINFRPQSTGQEVVIRRAHIFLLTDLFLICERMTPSERADKSATNPSADMWLLYPPLAGKHVRVADPGQDNVFSVVVLKKETLTIHTDCNAEREDWLRVFDECNRFANNMGLQVKTGSLAANVSAMALGGGGSTPALSPAISVTPSSLGRDSGSDQGGPNMFSPHSSTGSSLMREGSFNSVASFPKLSNSAPSSGSPDLRLPSQSPASGFSSRSPSPSSPVPPMPARMGSTGPPRPGQPMGPSGGFGRPPPFSNDPMSPNFRPQMHMGRPPPGPGGLMSPPGGLMSPPSGPGSIMSPPMLAQPQMGRPMGPPGSPSFRPAPMPNGAGGAGGPGYFGARPPGPGGPPQTNGRSPFSGPPGQPGARPSLHPNGAPPPPPPQQREPTRRPSAPNLRDEREPRAPPNRSRSASSLNGDERSNGRPGVPQLPSDFLKNPAARPKESYSPPSSPTLKPTGPVTSTVAAQMRCRLYLKQSHAQWKSLGNARLKLYHLMPADQKQLVVENDRKTLISTIVLTDGVERVGKVGVAVELSDSGQRTGIIYMLQMRSEESASGLFGQLLEGSDRTAAGGGPPSR